MTIKRLFRKIDQNLWAPMWILLIVLAAGQPHKASAQGSDALTDQINTNISDSLGAQLFAQQFNYFNRKQIRVDTSWFNADKDTLTLVFNKALAEMPVREEVAREFRDSISIWLPDSLKHVSVRMITNGMEFENLIPNYYRTPNSLDLGRLSQHGIRPERKNVVTRKRSFAIEAGLKDANLAIWNSHGWYYDPVLDRWEWQRARLFTSLEDISPTAFVIPFLAPMLENAGANVFIPRERDWQPIEIIVDNDRSSGRSKFKKPRKREGNQKGFTLYEEPYLDENPFKQGTSLQFSGFRKENVATYIPQFPKDGDYGVSVSYGKGEGEVTYRVYYSGGFTDFEVDQRMGYGTWIYLDKFHFKQGRNKEIGRVELIVPEGSDKKYSADAVRFGGGPGVVARNGITSGRAKFFEGARYYLQYAGAPDTLVWKLNDNDDYKDDYMSRGEWVDWLMGAPFGPTKNREYPGLKVPIDLAFAFHTDAGILPGEGIVGTLGIYSTDRDTNVFADGQSKYASRDLTDLVQTQIVDDINAIYKSNWPRRGMWNSLYSEAYRPQVPTMLLELLSHQNLNDVRYVLNPKFRFDVSRAIYKAMLRFIATQNGLAYVVQPLPVDHLSSEFTDENTIKLSWKPVLDPLEPSAKPEKYMVYKRVGGNGFDNGTLVSNPEITIDGLEKGKIYGFRITAVNAGGESFPSEVLSVGFSEGNNGNILIVNGFDRVDGPEIFDTETYSGVLRQLDEGVAWNYDISTVGDQYDFDRSSPWLDDDSPGHGASYANLETTIFRGNTFDFSYEHGKSIMAAGFNFVTLSDETAEENPGLLEKFGVIDLLYGEEKSTVLPGKDSTLHFSIYTPGMLDALENYTDKGGNILLSGAYIGSDIPKDTAMVNRIGKLFHMKWRTDHAAKTGRFYSVTDALNFKGEINTGYNLQQYPVESPDGIEPFDEKAETIFRYTENNYSAAVFYNGERKVITLGFPFESIKGQNERDRLMKLLLDVLTTTNYNSEK